MTTNNPSQDKQIHFPVEMSLDQCIKCNICTTACPVSAVSDLFPGPKYEGPQAGRFRQENQDSPDHSVDFCSGCRVCNMVCPTGVKIAEMNARARADLVSQGKVNPRLRLRNNLIARTELIGKLGQPIAPVANLVLSNPLVRRATELTLGIHHQAPLPAFSNSRFSTWFNQQPPPDSEQAQVVYFHGCATEYYEPWVGQAAVQVLNALGYGVIVPPQNCCGLPLLSNGEFPAARQHHLNNVKHLVEYARHEIPIVGTSTSCTLTLKEEAPELLDMHDQDTLMVAAWTFDFNEFLLNAMAGGLILSDLQSIPLHVVYHVPCQYRAHRIGKPGIELLSLIPALSVIDSQASCCGIAGTYGYKHEKYDISMEVGKPLFDKISSVNGPLVICDSETCRWQITHATGLPAFHPVEILAYAMGLPVYGPLRKIISA